MRATARGLFYVCITLIFVCAYALATQAEEAKEQTVESKQCDELRAEAAAKRWLFSEETISATGKENLKDYCLGAVLTPDGSLKWEEGDPLSPADYMCTGEYATVSLKKEGTTVHTKASKGIRLNSQM